MPSIDPKITRHHIPLYPGANPIKQKLRQMKEKVMNKIWEEFQNQLEARFLEVVKYPIWIANVVLILKKDGKLCLCMCVDYWDLNNAIPKDHFPLPHIDILVDHATRVTTNIKPKEDHLRSSIKLGCSVVPGYHTEEYKDLFQNGLPAVINWNKIVDDDTRDDQEDLNDIEVVRSKYVQAIKLMLNSNDDGQISASAYDTAWVALIEDPDISGRPQFPLALQWIIENQLHDGSWGDEFIFEAHDRILNTMACVVALKHWNIHPDKCEQGMLFIRGNLKKLEDEKAEHMPIGFEVAFPSLIELAKKVGIEIPDDSPLLNEIYSRRNIKMKRIPKDIMHKVPTTLLHSLEGMPDLDWEKLMKLQSQDGSFLFSPSSTAFALSQTKEPNCFAYLERIVNKFNGGVPNVYPVDLFQRIWMVDRLERLGISRYFQPEIKQCVEYVHKYWTEDGICWARNSKVQDIDDTAMGFRTLRLHGYDVSADVFKNFEKNGEFYCFAGQSTQAITGMLNLYRGSQIIFPNEHILEDAKKFSSKFLREKQMVNEIFDKWIITKDLPGEVKYALDVPWHVSLPRLETRFYLEQYGGQNDVWIGKTLYRMPFVNNDLYLELAKIDYNNCQTLHQLEWDIINKWYNESNLSEYGMSENGVLLSYYLAAASIFEPERSQERLAWAKTSILIETIKGFFNQSASSFKDVADFIEEFKSSNNSPNLHYEHNNINSHKTKGQQNEGLVGTLIGIINKISLDTIVAHGRDIRPHLHDAWVAWMMTWKDGFKGEAGLIIQTINMCAGQFSNNEVLINPVPLFNQFLLTYLMNYRLHIKVYEGGVINGDHDSKSIKKEAIMDEIEGKMQELLQLVLSPSADHIDNEVKKTFLIIARSCYYAAYFSSETITSHIDKVLFHNVI
ncbi:ent-copalyl diphosphate synthase 1-like [Impatiens glandulifera]|uniref:ent-copalyl diphosphate synthase 1-like n=1 Tax=Impatiens glandulifera TaxID=253017 RepID=UPI001FB19DE8|nr:ent-copalyl diphosphate synthase 1-like [Impatiens glandulifera]